MVFQKMSEDFGQDTIPVKDGPSRRGHDPKDDLVHQRRVVAKLSHEELEDHFLRLSEENLLLKRHGRKQDERIKKMATKLVRLINDHKKQDGGGGGGTVGKKRDIETEELIEEMQEKIRDLDKQNTLVKEKLVAAKQQLAIHTRRASPCLQKQRHSHHSLAIPKAAVAKYSSPNDALYSSRGSPPPQRDDLGSPRGGFYKDSPPPPHEAQHHQRYLPKGNPGGRDSRQHYDHNPDILIADLREQLDIYDREIDNLRVQLKEQEMSHEEELLALKSQVTQSHRHNLQENVELIKLQRETKETNNKMAALMEQYNKLQQNYHVLKGSHDQLLREIDNITAQLKEEQRRVYSFQNELQAGAANNLVIAELKEQISSSQKENALLKESNSKLMNSTFGVERERVYRSSETSLKIQIAQLEATLKADLEEKNALLQRWSSQKAASDQLEEDAQKLQVIYHSVREENDRLKERVETLTREQDMVDPVELEEALLLVRSKRDSAAPTLDFLQAVPDDPEKSVRQQLQELQTDHAETVNELVKIRNMLQLQYKINTDYKKEAELVRHRLEQVEREAAERDDENQHLLELRSARIERLESRLKEAALETSHLYSSQSFAAVVESQDVVHRDTEGTPPSHGTNVLEIHMKKVVLSKEGIRVLRDENPPLFLTWSFYDFELMSTGVVAGRKANFSVTAQYDVEVDDQLMQYLNQEKMSVELHLARGEEYTTLAAAEIGFQELIEMKGGRLYSSVMLTGTYNGKEDIVFGTIEYWMSLQVPICATVKVRKEKWKGTPFVTTTKTSYKDTVSESEQRLEHDTPQQTAAREEEENTTILAGSSNIAPVPKPRRTKEIDPLVVAPDVATTTSSVGGKLVAPTRSSTPNVATLQKPPVAPRSTKGHEAAAPMVPADGHDDVPASEPLSIPSTSNYTALQPKPKEDVTTVGAETVDESISDLVYDSDEEESSSAAVLDRSLVVQESKDDSSESSRSSSDGDSEDVITTSRSSPRENLDRVVIEVCHLTLHKGARIAGNPSVQMLFVDYRFLGYPPEELETPYALPKPKPNQTIAFNFHKVFHVDPEKNYKKRQFLASMLLPNSPDKGIINFTVVSEPPESSDMDCEDVGYAYVDVNTILLRNKDYITEDIKVYDSTNAQVVIGTLNVTVEMLTVLNAIKREMT